MIFIIKVDLTASKEIKKLLKWNLITDVTKKIIKITKLIKKRESMALSLVLILDVSIAT